MDKRGHDTIDHTADMGIRGWGESREQAFEETALAMFGLIIDGSGLKPDKKISFEVGGQSPSELLVEFLNRMLSDADIEEIAILYVYVESIEDAGGALRLKGGAEGISREAVRERLSGEVKAATYYGASVEVDGDGRWEARCVVDL